MTRRRETAPRTTYGPWLPTCYLRLSFVRTGRPELEQKMRRKVKRDWSHGTVSNTYDYEWQPVGECAT